MKSYLFILIALLNLEFALAQVFDVEAIKVSGDNDKRINLVILSEGYQSTEFSKFIADATSFTNSMFSQSPFIEYIDYFNVYAIKVPSTESGADHPGTATDVTEPKSPVVDIDTYFNTSFDTASIHRLLYTYNSSTIYNVLANNFPQYDQPVILVNSPEYGGAGGSYAVSSTGANANEIAIHELGHSLFNLKDEYYPGDDLAAEAINMTQEINPTLVKWKNWIDINGIGIYPYATSGNAATWNRPHQNCKMRYLNVPFCSVCKEGMIEKIHSLISPIDFYSPNSNTVDSPSFPLNFQLNLIEPNPNTLESEWTLNSVSFASNIDNISIEETDLIAGNNILSVVVNDNSSFLKVDNHETFHVFTVTWTINNTTLGIESLDTKTNRLRISMFPNPTNTVLNLKVESEKESNLRVEIIAVDGKKIKTIALSNFQTKTIDISNLTSGIYITNFYANQVLISSKKLVKN
jgi:hypothetical protein